ncbi:MAG: DUF721 domain-containing protein [Bdellovibrionales bacterium]|nr:DUF721 domain-containing protein [Bdellovibrionales bacterium]
MSNKKQSKYVFDTPPMFKTKFKQSRTSNLETPSQVLESTFKGKSFFSQGFIRWRVWGSWSEIVGKDLAAQTEPVFHRDFCLSIWASTPALAQDLSFSSEPLKEKINKFVGSDWVKTVRITSYKKQNSVNTGFIKNLKKFF